MAAHTPRVLITTKYIPKCALEMLQSRYDVEVYDNKPPIPRHILFNKIKEKDALFCLLTDKIDKEVLDSAGSTLKIISTMSVGYDHIDIKETKARKIKIGYTPGVLTQATAELTMALLLATSRRIAEANKQVYNGGWRETGWSPLWMTGVRLSGSTVGFFGFGRIGQAVAKQLQGFNIGRLLYNARSEKEEAMALGVEFVAFDSLLSQSDFLIVVCDLNENTSAIFNGETFSKMKPNCVFVNTSRGGVVDHSALVQALKEGRIRAAGLDVMVPEPLPEGHPLLTAPNLTLLPHIGSADLETRTAMAILAAENIIAVLEGKVMPSELVV